MSAAWALASGLGAPSPARAPSHSDAPVATAHRKDRMKKGMKSSHSRDAAAGARLSSSSSFFSLMAFWSGSRMKIRGSLGWCTRAADIGRPVNTTVEFITSHPKSSAAFNHGGVRYVPCLSK